ncbi:MAG: DUF4838 domain-containing protein [Treponema sp.]|nr:DUF4838 domain-containing protein [Treponema sp.]
MDYFNASKGWTILFPPDVPHAKKAVEDLSRYIGLLASVAATVSKAPPVMDALGPSPEGDVIVLSCGLHGCEQNGFSWRAGEDRVEILGESGRGLCNGIYSFLSALGISWPAPGQEEIPTVKDASGGRLIPLASAGEFSLSGGDNPPADSRPSPTTLSSPTMLSLANLRRFVPDGNSEVKALLKKSEAFVEWAARCRYDAIVFPLAAYASVDGRKLKQLRQLAGEYGIALEAGGRELSSLVPRRYFFLHRDFFRMDDGKRTKDHHFCPTNPDVTRLIAKEGGRLFRSAADAPVIHLWPDEGAETAWCSCPTCRAFSSLEQNRIAINTAADALAALRRDANPVADRDADFTPFISYFEKPGEGGKIPPRKNTFSLSELPGARHLF